MNSALFLEQLLFLAIMLIFGYIILLLRRKASGGKSFYKIVLMMFGLALVSIYPNIIQIFHYDFMKNISVILLVLLAFELSMRMNADNMSIKGKSLKVAFVMLIVNMFILTILTSSILNMKIVYALIFAVLMTSVDFFMFDEIKEEGDVANPILIVLTFMLLYTLGERPFSFVDIAQYVLIGIGVGIISGIIVFNTIRDHKIDWIHQLGLVAVAISVYIYTEVLLGSGILAVITLGLMLGNSFVNKSRQMVSFSPFIFKSLEIIVFMIAGFEIYRDFELYTVIAGVILFLAYLVLRFIVASLIYSEFSFRNRWFITNAPKGIVFTTMIILLATYSFMPYQIITTMIVALILSLIFSSILEYFETEKIKRLDRIFKRFRTLRYGRKLKKKFFKKHVAH